MWEMNTRFAIQVLVMRILLLTQILIFLATSCCGSLYLLKKRNSWTITLRARVLFRVSQFAHGKEKDRNLESPTQGKASRERLESSTACGQGRDE